jgi:hypothetical protein
MIRAPLAHVGLRAGGSQKKPVDWANVMSSRQWIHPPSCAVSTAQFKRNTMGTQAIQRLPPMVGPVTGSADVARPGC